MASLTCSGSRIEIRIDPSIHETHLPGDLQQAEYRDACRQLVERIGSEFSSAMSQLLLSGVAAEDFSRFEDAALQTSRACLQAVLKAGIESLDAGALHVVRGGKRYRRVDPTPREIMTSAGRIEYLRPRYRGDGETSIVPVDEQVRFAGSFYTELAAEQAMFMLSSLSPRECVSLYEKFRIDGASLSSMQRLAEVAGEHWEGCKEQALVQIRARETVPEEAATVCISLDGTMLPMLPEGKGEGKATAWREASVATLTCYDAEGERLNTLYLGQMPEARKATLKDQLATELEHVLGLRPDLRVTAVADAAADNWPFLSQYAPAEFQLIDYFHACQHLGNAAEHIFPYDDAAREKWFKRHRHILRDETEGVETVIRSLRYFRNKTGKLNKGLEGELNYFRNHRDRMQYKRHEDLNLPIGSGITESACKTLVGGRMKRSGQRWGMEGGKSILAFRALARSDRFDAAWIAIRNHIKANSADNDNRPHHLLKQAA